MMTLNFVPDVLMKIRKKAEIERNMVIFKKVRIYVALIIISKLLVLKRKQFGWGQEHISQKGKTTT